MTGKLTPQPGIMKIRLYEGGQSALDGFDEVLKLSSNENPLGPPPVAQRALSEALAGLHLYPSTDHAQLRRAIGEVHGLDPERIICGVGSDEVLQFLCQAFTGPGDEVIYTEHGFSLYPVLIHAAGATPVKAPEKKRIVDVDAILSALNDKTRLVFLTNPGNPTGTMLTKAELERLAEGIPESVLLVIDGAYTEYADGFDGGASLATERDNVVMTRTFSKIYGLGGLRIGWGYGARAIIDVLNRIRQPFNLSVAQLAAAQAAVEDQEWVRTCAELNAAQRGRFIGALHQLGIACDESHTNFVLARFQDEAEAERANSALQAQGIIVRKVAGYGFPEALRVTIGDEEKTSRVIDALTDWRESEQ